jgi:hypothetical protein
MFAANAGPATPDSGTGIGRALRPEDNHTNAPPFNEP